VSTPSDYALALSEDEVERYRSMAERARHSESAQWAAIGIAPGATVADVGCGPGAVSTLVAQLVGPAGHVWAVDQDRLALATAEQLAARLGLTNVSFHAGRADSTSLPAAGAEVVMMRHVLAHNGGREQAIVDHLATLVRPGGFVYLVDVEAEGARVRPAEPDIVDISDRYRAFQAQRGNDLSVGLRLGELVAGAGLELVDFGGRYDIFSQPGFRPPSWAARQMMVDAGCATPDDVARWGSAFERIDAESRDLTYFVPMFWAIGRGASRGSTDDSGNEVP
jgi:ubiquinone/menaquinone biosynthesis C-methylase UbiE